MRIAYVEVLAAAVALAAGCGSREESAPVAPAPEASQPPAKPAEWPRSDDPVLAAGRVVWVDNCENCHGIGKAESPRFLDYEAWAPRLAKGEPELIHSAIHGFEGKTEAGMPPRGGNKKLTDEEVTAATKYMIHFSRQTGE